MRPFQAMWSAGGHTEFRIGDTLARIPSLTYAEIPRSRRSVSRGCKSEHSAFKRFREGLEQLLQEGSYNRFSLKDSSQRVPLLGAVGPLQFEVVQTGCRASTAPITPGARSLKILRWIATEDGAPF